MFDTHLHTTFSSDAVMTFAAAIAEAKKRGLGIIITEHLDLDYPENPEAFLFDVQAYFSALEPFRGDQVLLGVELGLREDLHEKNKQAVEGWPFDEIIGSIHVVDKMDIYRPNFTEGRTKKEAYTSYLQAMLHCIENFAAFDTLGHVDYICRYARYEDKEIHLTEFYEAWVLICRALIEREKALELNTRRLNDPKALAALKLLYQEYKKQGGKYITIGSDAHEVSKLAANFDIAWQLAESLSLKPVYFQKRKMQYDCR